MTATLLTFYDLRAGTALRAGANIGARPKAKASVPRVAKIRHPSFRSARLECTWHVDPATGALSARWTAPNVHARRGSAREPENADRRSCDRLRKAARGRTACSRAAARLAA
jgi:hypothetical protein